MVSKDRKFVEVILKVCFVCYVTGEEREDNVVVV